MEWIPWVNNIDKYCQCLGGTGFWTGREGTVQHLTFSLFSHSFPHPGIISSAPTSKMIICHLGNDPNVSCKWSLTIHPPSFQLCQSLASFQGFKENSKYDAFFCKCVPSFFANVFLFFANMFRFFLQMCSDFLIENVLKRSCMNLLGPFDCLEHGKNSNECKIIILCRTGCHLQKKLLLIRRLSWEILITHM